MKFILKNKIAIEELTAAKEDIRWEARFFWPEQEVIVLKGLSEIFLNLSQYKIKHRHDQYLILPDNLNIKQRKAQLIYKPLLQKHNNLFGYGKKINLHECAQDAVLPATNMLTAKALLHSLKEAFRMDVIKEALLYTFPSNPKIILELSRLKINEAIFFSVCLEGRSQQMVSDIAKELIGKINACDYLSFLKKNFFDNDND